MESYQRERLLYRKYLKDKRIVLILDGEEDIESKELIHSYDIIIRYNQSDKCDVLYFSKWNPKWPKRTIKFKINLRGSNWEMNTDMDTGGWLIGFDDSDLDDWQRIIDNLLTFDFQELWIIGKEIDKFEIMVGDKFVHWLGKKKVRNNSLWRNNLRKIRRSKVILNFQEFKIS